MWDGQKLQWLDAWSFTARLLLRMLLFVLRKDHSPICSMAEKLNGHGFVVVPAEQWFSINTELNDAKEKLGSDSF